MAAVNDKQNIDEKILEICNQLKVGPQIKLSDIEISKFKSGFVSDIYRVTFLQPQPNLPENVVIKLYNLNTNKKDSGFEIIDSQLNTLLVGNAQIGPKVHLILSDALVMDYVTGDQQLTREHDADLSLREIVARKLAQFHTLDVPIARSNQMDGIVQLFENWFSKVLIDSIESGVLHNEFIKNNFENLLSNNIKSEVDSIYGALKRLNHNNPEIVFGHCDFNHLNILVSENLETRKSDIKFIDFDFSMFFFRGADLGRYFVDCNQPEQFHSNDLISEQEITQFVNWYRDERTKLDPKFNSNPQNSTDQILSEIKLFALYAYLKDCIFCLSVSRRAAEEDNDPEKMLQFLTNANRRFGGYLKVKERFLNSGLVL